MAITPRYFPGQLVALTAAGVYRVGLVLSTTPALRRGDPVFLKVQWTNSHSPPSQDGTEYIDQQKLRLVKDERRQEAEEKTQTKRAEEETKSKAT